MKLDSLSNENLSLRRIKKCIRETYNNSVTFSINNYNICKIIFYKMMMF